MREWQGKRYWLVGASAGLGAALAHNMSRAGVDLVISARSEDDLNTLAQELPGRAQVLPMDVTSGDSVAAAAAQAGDIDGIVYLAGVYWPLKASEWDADKITAMAEVNYVGALRVLGQVMPAMTARDRGHVVLTGSLSGYRGLPGAVGYVPTKSAIMSLAESMYCDLRKTGVEVQLVNPGFIKTRLTEKNDFHMPFIMEPEDAAREIFEHMNSDSFQKAFPTVFSWVFRLGQLLPDWAYYRLFS